MYMSCLISYSHFESLFPETIPDKNYCISSQQKIDHTNRRFNWREFNKGFVSGGIDRIKGSNKELLYAQGLATTTTFRPEGARENDFSRVWRKLSCGREPLNRSCRADKLSPES